MTTRTFAARRFADEHGRYSSIDGSYTLSSRYQPSTDTVPRSRLTAAQFDTQQAYMAQRDATEAHTADLKIVMALLGVEDQYEDTVENVYAPGGAYMRGYYKDQVTKTAVQKFAEDLRAAQSAVEGQAALKRLRKAIKSVTKEESK